MTVKIRKYIVEWTLTGKNDLLGIADYIAEDSLDAAFEFIERIEQRASDLWSFPERGRVVPELADFGVEQIRETIVSPWRIIYRVGQEQVLVLAVFDGHRNLEDVLFERFKIFR